VAERRNGEPGGPLAAGIDVGTQSVRVVLLGEDGAVAGRGAAPLRSTRPADGRHEQDPEGWWRAVGAAAREATHAAGGDRGISGLAVCSTSGTVLLADAAGRPVAPAIMYDDGRAAEEAREVRTAGEATWNRLGYGMGGSFGLPRLLWMLRHDPSPRATRLMHSADYVASRLAGEPVATDWSHALKTGYDLQEERWPAEIMERVGVPAGLLPRVVRPGTHLGVVGRDGARHTGFPQGTPILAGMTDGCAAQVSAGALEEGRWNSVLGTTLVLKGATSELLRDPSGALYSHRHPDGGWLPGGASNVGAGILSREFPDRDLAELDARAEARGPASSTVTYPLAGRGERFPFSVPDARGFWIGEPTDVTERYRAILEGVAFVERLCFAHVEALGAAVQGPVSFTGGGTRSPFWSQLRADVLGRPVVVPRSAEPASGMAILAHAGTGYVTDAARRAVTASSSFEPRPREVQRLAEGFGRLVAALVERGYVTADLAGRARMG